MVSVTIAIELSSREIVAMSAHASSYYPGDLAEFSDLLIRDKHLILHSRRLLAALAVLAIFGACSSGAPGARTGSDASSGTVRAEPGRTLVAAVRVEPYSIAARPPEEAGVATYLTKGMFNAEL